jgi:hypothetical protein
MKLLFVRYGGLSSVPQGGYDATMPTYHAPPARRGIYAFVAPTVTRFLIFKEQFDSRRMEWIRDPDGKKKSTDLEENARLLESSGLLECFARDGGRYLARHKKPKLFAYGGEIWHHLPVSRQEIIKEKGGWVLTTARAHRDAFRRALNKRAYARRNGHPSFLLDDFEVFLEKV